MSTRVLDKFSRLVKHGAMFGCGGHGHAASAAELQEPLLAKDAEGAQHGVRVHSEDGGEVSSRRESLTGRGFSVRDRAADLGRDLFVEVGGVCLVDLDMQHDISNNSIKSFEVITMLVDAPPREDEVLLDAAPPGEVELLIEEARRHARRRRQGFGVTVAVLTLVGLGVIGAVAIGGSGSSAGPAEPPGIPAPVLGGPGGAYSDMGVFAPIRGWIVFPSGDSILAIDPDDPSSTRTVLASPEGISSHVSPLGWSADGTKLALDDEGETGTWVLDSNGSLRNLSGSITCCMFVHENMYVSPDGRSIGADVDRDVLRLIGPPWVSHDGTPAVDLSNYYSAWSIDRSAVAVPVGDHTLVMVDLEDGRTRVVRNPGIQIATMAWSADSEKLVLTAPGWQRHGWLPTNPPDARGLYVADFDGAFAGIGEARPLRISSQSFLTAVWSPDGTRIAAIQSAFDREIVVMNADGSNSHPIASLDTDEFTGIAWHPLPAEH